MWEGMNICLLSLVICSK